MFLKRNSLFKATLTYYIIYSLFVISANVSAATASISTSGTVNIDVSSSGNSANIGTDTVTVNTTCSSGYTVAIKSSISDATLYKDGDATSTSKISPSSGTLSSPASILGNNLGTWGYSLTDSTVSGNFIGLTNTPTIIKQSSVASAATGDQIPVYFGVSIPNTLEPGQYKMSNSGTIVYQLTMPVICDTYTIKYNGNNNDAGTTMSVVNDNLNLNNTTTLMPSNYKRAGYGFAGWNTKADGTGENFGPMETVTLSTTDTKGNALIQAADQNKEITLYAKWIQSAGNIQGWTGCPAMNSGDVTALTDTRDNNVYAVAKLADGNCWMIENMRLGGSSAINLTSADTNISSNVTLPASTNTFTTSNYTTMEMSAKNTLETVSDMTTPTNAEVYSYGNYYSWPAAIGSTTAYSTWDQSVSTSICPSGWHLPTGTSNGEFYNMNTNVNSGPTNSSAGLRKYPANFLNSGNLVGSSFDYRGSSGWYWSSTVLDSTTSYFLFLNAVSVDTATLGLNKYYGFSVRCVADKSASPGKIMYHDNGAESPTKMDEQVSGYTTKVTLWPSNFQHKGGDFGFAGWNTKKDGTGTSYGPMEEIPLPSDFATNGLNLYAMWIPSAGNIQNWNGCSSLAQGAVTALKDTRDGNTYAVAKLADGNCWMIENLRLGGSSAMNLTTANTVTAFTLPASTDKFDDGYYTSRTTIQMSAKNTLETVSNMTSADQEVYSYGNYYSWPAAIGSTTAYSTENQSVSTSICPSGWHLPKGGRKANTANSEFWKLSRAIIGSDPANFADDAFYYTGNPEGTNASNLHRKYPNNFLYSGRLYGPSFVARGSDGFYWSSTVYNNLGANYLLNLYYSRLYPGTNTYVPSMGLSVRCVAGS